MANQTDRQRRILDHVSRTYPGVKAPLSVNAFGRPNPPTSDRSRRILDHVQRTRG